MSSEAQLCHLEEIIRGRPFDILGGGGGGGGLGYFPKKFPVSGFERKKPE